MVSLRCLKWALPLSAVLWALILWPVFAQPVFLDVCLSMTGTNAQARAAIRVLGLDKEMLVDISKDQTPNEVIVGYNHHVAIDIWERPILDFGPPPVFAPNPIMRIRFISQQARDSARLNIINANKLTEGLQKIPCPATRIWAGESASEPFSCERPSGAPNTAILLENCVSLILESGGFILQE